jgi:hypothetical protein
MRANSVFAGVPTRSARGGVRVSVTATTPARIVTLTPSVTLTVRVILMI